MPKGGVAAKRRTKSESKKKAGAKEPASKKDSKKKADTVGSKRVREADSQNRSKSVGKMTSSLMKQRVVSPQNKEKINCEFTLLSDPCNDRQLTDAKCPRFAQGPLDNKKLWPGEAPDWKLVRDFLQREGKLTKQQMIRLMKQAIKVFKTEANLVRIAEPVCVVGDIHGQYYDMLTMLGKIGDPCSNMNYCFMGDYVDRGIFGIEVCILLFCMKIALPKNVIVLRGNHESRNLTTWFTFRKEVLDAYDVEIYDLFNDVFDAMPVAAIVGDKHLAVHGGISPDLKTLQQIEKFDRHVEIPFEGLFCDLIWADPMEDKDAACKNFTKNEARGASFMFGRKPCKDFLEDNGLRSIFRGH